MKAGRREEARISKAIQGIKRLASELGVHTNIDSLSRQEFIEKSNRMDKVMKSQATNREPGATCFEPWYHMVIKVDGSVGPCCIFEEKALNVKTMSLSGIWHGKWFNDMRERMKRGDLPGWCRICNAGQVTQNERLREGLKNE